MTIRRFFISSIVILLLAGGLALDLANRGLVWQFAWSVTGEETPVAQARGLLQWAGNVLRPMPETQPMTPVQHTNVSPYGINTFLEQEPNPDKVEAKLEMISDAGFDWIRQQFVWEDIEIHDKGDFMDRRNVEAVGVVSAWRKYDRIVNLAEQHDLQIQARLDNPPSWSRSQPDEVIGPFAPPDDYQDFVDYAIAVAERYKGRIQHYQVWNEPNIFPEWGNQSVSPEDYTRLLCMTYDALKEVDPDNVVITGALAPTQSLTGRDLNDFIFLQRMYQAGAGECFDVLSMQGYGLNSGPTDRRMRPNIVNVGRNQYIRDIMLANGDAHKPIWLSEAAWNFVPPREEAPNIAEPRTLYGQVTKQQAADYITRFYQRAREEWPWVGVVNYWFFSRADASESNQPFYYFRMVEPQFNPEANPPFQPLPVYTAMKDYITGTEPVLYQGVHQVDQHPAVQVSGTAHTVRPDGAQFDRALQTESLRVDVHGTAIALRWRSPATLRLITVDGQRTLNGAARGDGWFTARAELSRTRAEHTVALEPVADEGDAGALVIDSISVMDETLKNLYPLIVLAITGGITLLVALWDGLRERQG